MAEKHEAVHMYFELTYANYLVIPRSILQSMPDKWQQKFIKLVEEMDDDTEWRRDLGFYQYRVTPVDLGYTGRYRDGEEVVKDIVKHDKYMDYDKGRIKWPLKSELEKEKK